MLRPDNLKAVMVVRGAEFEQMLEVAKPRAERCLGMPITVLRPSPEEDLWVFKMSLLSKLEAPVLCLDTDLLFFDWDWDEFDWNRFNAVLDLPLLKWSTGVRELGKYYDVKKGVNGGMWYAPYTLDHLRVFHCAKNFILYESQKCRYAFGDQTALNTALYRLQTDVHFLPYAFNYHVFKDETFPCDTKVVHVIGDTLNTEDGKPHPERKLRRFLKLAQLPELK
jgi:hypothetical protein